MPNSKPVPARVWPAPDGRTFSPFSAWRPEGSTLESAGWTVAHADGTQGLGRSPFATREEAQAWCDAHPHFPGMRQD